VKDGEDDRAGRWRGNEKTECGLHVIPLTPAAEAPVPVAAPVAAAPVAAIPAAPVPAATETRA